MYTVLFNSKWQKNKVKVTKECISFHIILFDFIILLYHTYMWALVLICSWWFILNCSCCANFGKHKQYRLWECGRLRHLVPFDWHLNRAYQTSFTNYDILQLHTRPNNDFHIDFLWFFFLANFAYCYTLYNTLCIMNLFTHPSVLVTIVCDLIDVDPLSLEFLSCFLNKLIQMECEGCFYDMFLMFPSCDQTAIRMSLSLS